MTPFPHDPSVLTGNPPGFGFIVGVADGGGTNVEVDDGGGGGTNVEVDDGGGGGMNVEVDTTGGVDVELGRGIIEDDNGTAPPTHAPNSGLHPVPQ